MRSLILIFTACFMMTISFAKIPEKITNAFHLKYSAATNIKWKNNVINYTVTFDLMNARFQATFDKKGDWLRSAKRLRVKELPGIVKNGFEKTNYASWKILSSFEEYFPKEQPRYHVRAAKVSMQRKNLVFDSLGNLIQTK